MTIKLRPFQTPNYAIMEMAARPRQEGMMESPKFKLEELDVADLCELCDNWRREVFTKAGKKDPRDTTNA